MFEIYDFYIFISVSFKKVFLYNNFISFNIGYVNTDGINLVHFTNCTIIFSAEKWQKAEQTSREKTNTHAASVTIFLISNEAQNRFIEYDTNVDIKFKIIISLYPRD